MYTFRKTIALKITTNTWVSDVVELDINVSCQCYVHFFVVMFYWFNIHVIHIY